MYVDRCLKCALEEISVTTTRPMLSPLTNSAEYSWSSCRASLTFMSAISHVSIPFIHIDSICLLLTSFRYLFVLLYVLKDRDLKPENVLLSDPVSRKVKIADFGLALQKEEKVTRGVGTPVYMVCAVNTIPFHHFFFLLFLVLYHK